jgi:hypothetical protein
VTGTDAADFAALNDTCAGRTIAPAASCTVEVRFAPAHTADLGAQLTISDNAPNAPHNVTLTGIGVAATGSTSSARGSSSSGATAPATILQSVPLVAVAGVIARPLAVSSLTLSQRISITRLRLQGLRAAMRLPAGTRVVRFAVYHARNGNRVGSALAVGYRVPTSTSVYRLVLRDRALLRNLKRGSYLLQVRPGRSRSNLGATATIGFTVTR